VFFDDDGHISEYQSVGVDLTDRKLAEDALQQSESMFRALVENVSDVIFTVDLDGNFTYLSPSWETVTGHSIDNFLGIAGVALVHPADVTSVIKRTAKVFSGDHFTESLFYRVEHADGEWHWHATRGAPIVDEAGSVTGALGVVRDITHVRENQLLLQRSLDQLEQALKDKTMLMKEIHHRVKNNLQIVASLLSIQARQIRDVQAKDALTTSRDRVIAIASIHNMMYQGDSGDSVVFGAYLQTLIERIQRAFAASDITFEVNSDNLELPVNQAVPLALIVNELLTNAVKYAFAWPQGDARVNVRLADDHDSITMIVEDNGVGMPADIDPLNSDSLGMTIVQSLTAQLEGTVAFTNREDRSGLRVVVNVPRSEQ
jgi:PAS domain S-box-containing protein